MNRLLIEAEGVADGAGVASGPGKRGALMFEAEGEGAGWANGGRGRVIAGGDAEAVRALPEAEGVEAVSLDGHVLIPALVNAHTHLDLTSLGPRPYERERGFVSWLDSIRRARGEELQVPVASVMAGCEALRRGGVAGVGDIVGVTGTDWLDQIEAVAASGVRCVAFPEVFGLGGNQARANHGMRSALVKICSRDLREGRFGLQPHAPYSAGPDVFREACEIQREHGVPLATHLGESLAERTLVEFGSGALRDFLESLGLWDEESAAHFGRGLRPVRHLETALREATWLAVHVNDCSDAELPLLAETGTNVAYCPRASAYFGHADDLGPHRYREMLDAGVNVCLGTDSIVCLPPEEADRLSPLDEMRFLWRRDGTDPGTLLAMATVNGARSLGFDVGEFTLAPGPVAGVLAVDVTGTDPAKDPLAKVVASEGASRWVWPEV